MVWKVISSITPMIVAIRADDCSMARIASTAWRTISSEACAAWQALRTVVVAEAACAALSLTRVVMSASAAEVSSRLAAWPSMRRAISCEAELISLVPTSMLDTAPETLRIVSWSWATAVSKSSASLA